MGKTSIRQKRQACRKKGVDKILEIGVALLVGFGIGFVTGIATIFTLIKKAMGMIKRPKPPKT